MYTFEDLKQIMKTLRAEDGCPWDRAQDHDTLKKHLVEECAEVLEAIDAHDTENLCEELGDVLLQVLFHASIEEDAGQFTLDDVADGICKKLIFRHPFLFEQEQGRDADGALTTWEERKRKEKGQRTTSEAMDAVARARPALTRAQKLQEKAAKAGFDWDSVDPVLDKLEEELAELRQAVREQSNVEEELGDLLFAAAKAGRFLHVDGERALQKGCDKFIRRFRLVEELAGDKSLTERPVRELEELWRQAKQRET